MARTWFITGAGRGLGAEIAKAVIKAGDRAVATGRSRKAIADAPGPDNAGYGHVGFFRGADDAGRPGAVRHQSKPLLRKQVRARRIFRIVGQRDRTRDQLQSRLTTLCTDVVLWNYELRWSRESEGRAARG